MNENQKIKAILKEKKLKLTVLHKRLKQVFGENAITYRTLQRIIAADTTASASSLYQVCVGLGVTLRELKADSEKTRLLPEIVRRAYPLGFYIYNEKVRGEILSDIHSGQQILKLILKPKGATKAEQVTDKLGWVYCLKGEITFIIEDKRYQLKRGDSLSFDASLKHWLTNETKKISVCLLIKS